MNKSIYPDVDLINSREYYGAYNSKDLYKGKSFNMAGAWSPDVHYFNDDFITDFVVYKGSLLSCVRSHQSSSANEPELLIKNVNGVPVPYGVKNTNYWSFVIGSVPGEQGDPGEIYVPKYDEASGTLTWVVGEEVPVSPIRIKGDGITDIYDEELEDGSGVRIVIKYGSNNIEPFELKHGVDGSKLVRFEEHKFEDHTDYVLVFQDGDGTESRIPINIPHGDENIWIGETEPVKSDGSVDKEKIWYDPSDDFSGGWNSGDFLYESYQALGGDLSQEAFINSFSNIGYDGGVADISGWE